MRHGGPRYGNALHDRFDAWLDRLEAQVKAPTPTLEELTQAVFALRQELTQAITEGLAELAATDSLPPVVDRRGQRVVPRSAPWETPVGRRVQLLVRR